MATTDGLSTSILRLRVPHGDVLMQTLPANVPGSIEVPIVCGATIWADPGPVLESQEPVLGKTFRADLSRGVVWINDGTNLPPPPGFVLDLPP